MFRCLDCNSAVDDDAIEGHARSCPRHRVRHHLGDLKRGDWFCLPESLVPWLATDGPTTYGEYTLCVNADTGEAQSLSNAIHVCRQVRPY